MFSSLSRILNNDATNNNNSQETTLSYNIVATIIFLIVSGCFFFPCNPIVPLDRRAAAVLGLIIILLKLNFSILYIYNR